MGTKAGNALETSAILGRAATGRGAGVDRSGSQGSARRADCAGKSSIGPETPAALRSGVESTGQGSGQGQSFGEVGMPAERTARHLGPAEWWISDHVNGAASVHGESEDLGRVFTSRAKAEAYLHAEGCIHGRIVGGRVYWRRARVAP